MDEWTWADGRRNRRAHNARLLARTVAGGLVAVLGVVGACMALSAFGRAF